MTDLMHHLHLRYNQWGSDVKLTGNLAEQETKEAKRSGTLNRKGYLTGRNITRDSIQMDRIIIKQGIESYLWPLEKQLPRLKLRFKDTRS